jgi:threonine dehydratase
MALSSPASASASASVPKPEPAADETPDAIAAQIDRAAARIAGHVRHTPLLRVPGAQLGLACAELWLKLEHTQIGGSFKARGMFNRMLAQPVPAAGVVIASGGNAGIATAAAARALGHHCEVFLPELASAAKRAALGALGARVVVGGAAYADALAASLARQHETGALLMHAYDQPEVVAGAGTLAREMVVQGGGVPDRILVSVGGGGLVAGIAAGFAANGASGLHIDALEPVTCPTLHAALAAGSPVDVAVSGLAADALGAGRIGRIAWPICRRWVNASHLVPDAAIAAAQRELWQALRLAVEPAAALGLAALRAGIVQPAAHERVVLVLCGANFDPSTLASS